MLTDQIAATLSEISKSLQKFIKVNDDPGLLTGYSGAALFYAYYYKLTGKKKYLDAVYFIIERMMGALAEKELTYSHCSGIAGMAWCLHHLSKEGFIDESEDMFEDVDSFLSEAMLHDLSQGFYDFLHMGLGVTLYFLDKLPHPVLKQNLEEAVSLLENTAELNQYGISWPDRLAEGAPENQASRTYNLGLSHGVPAILSILGMLYEKNVSASSTLSLLTQGTDWLLSVKNRPEDKVVSLYPRVVFCEGKNQISKQSRMGWCYGDLSIATTLWNLGQRLDNEHFKQEALYTFKHTLQYRTRENGNVHDASLCHGTMGISHIYRRMFLATGDREFLNGSEKWLKETLQMGAWTNGPAGFKYKTGTGFKDSFNVLEGVAGIGLGLIAALDETSISCWDRCLLVS